MELFSSRIQFLHEKEVSVGMLSDTHASIAAGCCTRANYLKIETYISKKPTNISLLASNNRTGTFENS